MHYKNASSDWFAWLYVDFDTLSEYAAMVNLKCKKIADGEHSNYLAQLSKI